MPVPLQECNEDGSSRVPLQTRREGWPEPHAFRVGELAPQFTESMTANKERSRHSRTTSLIEIIHCPNQD